MRVQDLLSLSGKVAIVTGGGRGLGEVMAHALAEAGASVVVCSRRREACDAVAADIAGLGQPSLALAVDVTDQTQVQQMIQTTRQRFGSIDIVVNNAGSTWGAPAEEMPLDRWRSVMETNVTGTFLVSQAAGRVMIDQQRGGKIINLASVAGLRGSDPAILDATGYAASKGAIIAYTRDLAAKWASHRICINAIAPGWFPSRMSRAILERHGDRILARTPLGRYGNDDDLKGLVVLLASAASDYITGQIIVVDGGATII